jgi:hypothetical protein
MAFQTYSIALDSATQLKQAGAVTADGAGQVGGSDAVADLGGGYAEFDVVIDWTACEVASGDEKYDIRIEGCAASTFASGVYVLSRIILGDSSVTNNATDTPPSGRMVIHANNAAITSATDGNSMSALRYVRVYHDVAGAIATGLNYTAFLTARQ